MWEPPRCAPSSVRSPPPVSTSSESASTPPRDFGKGLAANVGSTVEAIKKAVSEAEQAAGVEVDAVFVSIGGGHLRGVNSQGVVAIQGRTREVTAIDVARAVDASRAVSLPPDREILHALTQ